MCIGVCILDVYVFVNLQNMTLKNIGHIYRLWSVCDELV